MPITLTQDSTIITIDLVDGYTARRGQGAIVHDILGSAEPEITSRPNSLRQGTLRLLFDCGTRGSVGAENDAAAAEEALAAGGSWVYADTDRPSRTMTFVVVDGLTLSLDQESRDHWWLDVPFQEIA